MNSLNFSQQDEVFDPANARRVTLIGAGSVGSQVALMLAKIGIRDLRVFDGDHVESHNIPMSAYGIRDLGLYKVEALGRILREQSDLTIDAVPRMYDGGPLNESVICCVDSMEARKLIWEEVRMNCNVDIFVDTRIAGEFVSVFAINPGDPDDIGYYEHFLYPSSEALTPTCGFHGIIYVSAQAAVATCANLTSKWSGGRMRRHFRLLVGQLEPIGS